MDEKQFVTVELGATLPLSGTQGFGNVKPLIRLVIDPTGDVEAQIKQQLEIGQIAFAAIDAQLDISVSEIIATDNRPGYREMVDKLKNEMDKFKTRLTVVTDVVEERLGVNIRGSKKESSK